MNVDNYVCSIISAEVLSILVCLVLLYANLFKQHEKTPRNRLFSWSVVCCMLGLIADAASWILDGNEKMLPLLYVSTVISLIMVFIINGVFINYITAYVRENYPVSSTLSRIYMAFP